jgi:hypothetical protein
MLFQILLPHCFIDAHIALLFPVIFMDIPKVLVNNSLLPSSKIAHTANSCSRFVFVKPLQNGLNPGSLLRSRHVSLCFIPEEKLNWLMIMLDWVLFLLLAGLIYIRRRRRSAADQHCESGGTAQKCNILNEASREMSNIWPVSTWHSLSSM